MVWELGEAAGLDATRCIFVLEEVRRSFLKMLLYHKKFFLNNKNQVFIRALYSFADKHSRADLLLKRKLVDAVMAAGFFSEIRVIRS